MLRLDWLNQLQRSRPFVRLRPRRRAGFTLFDRIEECEPRCVLSADSLIGPVAQISNDVYLSPDELNQHLQDMAWQRWSGLFGQTIPQYDYGYGWWYGIAIDDVAIPLASSKVGLLAEGSVVSDTNTQVAGIDEADFIENDGQYLYIARGNQLTIINAAADDLSVAAQVGLDGFVVGEFLDGDRLTVVTQSYGDYNDEPMLRASFARPYHIWNWSPQTIVTVFDVTDRLSPTIAEQTVLDGSLQEARAVGSAVYLVLQNGLDLPEPEFVETPVEDGGDASGGKPGGDNRIAFAVAEDGAEDGLEMKIAVPDFWGGWFPPTIIANRTYETFEAYWDRVGDQLAELALPHVFGLGGDGELTDLGTQGGHSIVRPSDADQNSLLTIVAMNVADQHAGISDSASLFEAYPNAIYMTSDALVVATPEYESGGNSWQANTRLDRFTIDGTQIEWQAAGTVSGTLVNQFAIDEYDGFLRVATHVNSWQWHESDDGSFEWSGQNDNSVYVLDTSGDSLDVVGSIEGIAPGEQLFAARFLGESGYLVTFLRIDPLFTLDLSDPTQPQVVGELEIPGFSNYLQPAGEGQVFGIGQERTPGSWETRLHVSLFDVTDANSPQQIDREYLGDDANWVSSSAQYDHHALAYFSDGLLVLPVVSQSWGSEENGWNWNWQETLAVLQISDDGIETLGQITSSEPIVRTARIDNMLYVITDHSVTAYDLGDLALVASIDYVDWETSDHPPDDSADGRDDSADDSEGSSDGEIIYLSTGVGGGADERGNEADGDTPEPTQQALVASERAVASRQFVAVPAATSRLGIGLPVAAAPIANSISWSIAYLPAVFEQVDADSNESPRPFALPPLDDRSDADEPTGTELGDRQAVDQFWKQAGEQLRDDKSPMSPTDEAPDNHAAQQNTEKPRAATGEQTPRRNATRTNAPRSNGQQSQTPQKSATVAPAARQTSARPAAKSATPTKLAREVQAAAPVAVR